jgi:hypothetical protein
MFTSLWRIIFYHCVGFEVLIAVFMKSLVYWDTTPCKPRKFQHEGGSKQSSVCHLLHAGFLLGTFFDPEVGGDMFFRNVG